MRRGAHPRSCGADPHSRSASQSAAGSSPLVRGGRCRYERLVLPRGLIPARAGRTPCWYTVTTRESAHPRSCGADPSQTGLRVAARGSSPLVRGGLSTPFPWWVPRGLIPARAGRTRRHPPRDHTRSAHPRSCGADVVDDLGRRGVQGSSPLVRGGPPEALDHRAAAGLIPARAGRTTQRDQAWAERKAHPRSCGADLAGISPSTLSRGSSPLVRGGRRARTHREQRRGLIPARAGRTATAEQLQAGISAHPRSCGADRLGAPPPGWGQGSSPLVRGGHAGPDHPLRERGLIPARAGRTTAR